MLGELLPDQPDKDNPGLLIAQGCLPGLVGYDAFPSPVIDSTISANLLDLITGGSILYSSLGVRHKYAGGAVDIFEGDQYQNNFGGYGGLALDWEFVAFGDSFYATNEWDVLQSGVMGASTVADVTGAPRAFTIDVVREFLMTGGDRLTNFRTVNWSALGDPTDWTPSVTTQAGTQQLASGGNVKKIIGGEYATIFCERSIWRATYVGTPIIFQFDEVEKGRGAFDSGSVIKIGEMIYFLDPTGFYVFDGTNSQPIASNKIVNTFFSDMQRSTGRRLVTAADEKNTLIYWWYVSVGGERKCMVYNWTTGRWAGPTSVPATHAIWDPEFDAMSVFNTDVSSEFFLLNGAPEACTLETGEVSFQKGRRSVVFGVRPTVDGDMPNTTISVGVRDSTSGPVSYTPDQPLNQITGSANVEAEGRYHRVLLKETGDFTGISDIEPEVRITGAA